ncbi:MAG: aldo/keto reductase [Thermoanaerobaculia bacterium]|nr:aldo/keto reductase [Thermoanaerobaculia bacterium]
MRHRTFATIDDRIPVVGQGSWYFEKADRDAAIRAIHEGIDAGATHIDTAEMYGSGQVEEIVGEAIEGRRSDLFIVSKVLPGNASRRGTVEACERSLDRLGTETLDCYLLHWPGSYPLEQTFEAFEELREKGRVRSWGVSNFDERDLARAVEVAGEGKIACNQVLYHLKQRAIEHEVLPFCREHGIPIVAYSPFGSDDFPDPGSGEGAVLRQIADELDATPHQVALAFLLRHDDLFVIPRSTDPEHARQNAEAGSLELDEDQIARIDEAFPRGEWSGGVPVL